ncbi:MAG TPA: STM3941 family protein [Pyrinomonadaceae bacterium]|nr:STM3941 family protein [Pyrinomonadaceae bacterium]
MTISDDGTMKDIVIYSHRWYLKMAGICLLMVGLSIYPLIYPFEITGQDAAGRFFKSITPELFYISTLLFSLPLFYTCYRLLKRSPALIISQQGIFDNASIFSAGMIRWEEIKSLIIYSVMDNRMLGIIPVDIEPILARHSRVKRFLLSTGNDPSAAPFAIPEDLLPMSLEELLANIETYRNNRSPEMSD